MVPILVHAPIYNAPMRLLLPFLFLLLLPSHTRAADTNTDAAIEFENPWVRIVRVHYSPHQKTGVHDHPATPTIYVYVTDGGRLKIGHEGQDMVTRPPVKAGGIRFQKGVFERHEVEELDGVDSQYLRIELKTQPVDLPQTDVRRAPNDRTPYESGMVRIFRVSCPANSACPPSEHPDDPAVVVTGQNFAWLAPNSAA
ncbi:MAG: hypothetical protein JO022_22050, partial [Acidobacteriaceae bacterium]|nr:hypothetical protein [Acidobacteriaceae bacterium]